MSIKSSDSYSVWENVARETLPASIAVRELPPRTLAEFKEALESPETSERGLQAFLAAHRGLLLRVLRPGFPQWVIPQLRLGSKLVTDFVLGDRDSFGHHWYLVELESPHVGLFTAAGDPTHQLTHAIRQVQDWRRWLELHLDQAGRETKNQGMGLLDIRANIPGFVFIGRRAKILSAEINQRRRQWSEQHNIQIRTYDHLLDGAEAVPVI